MKTINNIKTINNTNKEELVMKTINTTNTEVTVEDALKVIGERVQEVGSTGIYVFYIGYTLYVYNSRNGIFYKFNKKIKDCVFGYNYLTNSYFVMKRTNKEEKDQKVLNIVYRGVLKESNLTPIGFARGGVDGVSYTGLTFFYKGKSIKVYAHIVAGVIKYGYGVMSHCLGKGSYYVIDHIDNNKTNNTFNNLQILTRTYNRWGKN